MNVPTCVACIACMLPLGGMVGCKNLAPPSIAYPGTATHQQARAEVFDPYPENEGGPAIEGSRPMDYEKPLPEVDRARHVRPAPSVINASWLPWNWGQGY